jgi:hypothetical protein
MAMSTTEILQMRALWQLASERCIETCTPELPHRREARRRTVAWAVAEMRPKPVMPSLRLFVDLGFELEEAEWLTAESKRRLAEKEQP